MSAVLSWNRLIAPLSSRGRGDAALDTGRGTVSETVANSRVVPLCCAGRHGFRSICQGYKGACCFK